MDLTRNDVLARLAATIAARRNADPEASYVAALFAKGEDAILKKIGEEATETVMAAKDGDPRRISTRSRGLWFHCLVLLARHGVTLDDVWPSSRGAKARPATPRRPRASADLGALPPPPGGLETAGRDRGRIGVGRMARGQRLDRYARSRAGAGLRLVAVFGLVAVSVRDADRDRRRARYPRRFRRRPRAQDRSSSRTSCAATSFPSACCGDGVSIGRRAGGYTM